MSERLKRPPVPNSSAFASDKHSRTNDSLTTISTSPVVHDRLDGSGGPATPQRIQGGGASSLPRGPSSHALQNKSITSHGSDSRKPPSIHSTPRGSGGNNSTERWSDRIPHNLNNMDAGDTEDSESGWDSDRAAAQLPGRVRERVPDGGPAGSLVGSPAARSVQGGGGGAAAGGGGVAGPYQAMLQHARSESGSSSTFVPCQSSPPVDYSSANEQHASDSNRPPLPHLPHLPHLPPSVRSTAMLNTALVGQAPSAPPAASAGVVQPSAPPSPPPAGGAGGQADTQAVAPQPAAAGGGAGAGGAAAAGGGGGGAPAAGGAKKMQWKEGKMLGAGAYGKVWIGLNCATGKLMAVKKIQFDTKGADVAKQLEKLRHEVGVMRSLKHDNIVQYLCTERTGNTVNIFMEYIAGGSISSLLRQFGPFTEAVVISYTKMIGRALEHLHKAGVIHRDVKGANVLVDVDGNCKVCDFGTAASIKELHKAGGEGSAMQGTPFWMAPEVIADEQYNASCDIWSLGCTILEMLTAKHPFEHLATGAMQVMNLITRSRKEVDLPPKVVQETSENGVKLLRDCLRKNPAARPNATGVLMNLERDFNFDTRMESEYASSYYEDSHSTGGMEYSNFFYNGGVGNYGPHPHGGSVAGSTAHSQGGHATTPTQHNNYMHYAGYHQQYHMGSPTQTEFDGGTPQYEGGGAGLGYSPGFVPGLGLQAHPPGTVEQDSSSAGYTSDGNGGGRTGGGDRTGASPQPRRAGGAAPRRNHAAGSPVGLKRSRSRTDVQTSYSGFSNGTPQMQGHVGFPLPPLGHDASPAAQPLPEPAPGVGFPHPGILRTHSHGGDGQSVRSYSTSRSGRHQGEQHASGSVHGASQNDHRKFVLQQIKDQFGIEGASLAGVTGPAGGDGASHATDSDVGIPIGLHRGPSIATPDTRSTQYDNVTATHEEIARRIGSERGSCSVANIDDIADIEVGTLHGIRSAHTSHTHTAPSFGNNPFPPPLPPLYHANMMAGGYQHPGALGANRRGSGPLRPHPFARASSAVSGTYFAHDSNGPPGDQMHPRHPYHPGRGGGGMGGPPLGPRGGPDGRVPGQSDGLTPGGVESGESADVPGGLGLATPGEEPDGEGGGPGAAGATSGGGAGGSAGGSGGGGGGSPPQTKIAAFLQKITSSTKRCNSSARWVCVVVLLLIALLLVLLLLQ